MHNPLILTVFLQATLYCVNTRVFNNTQGARIVNGEDAVEGEFPFVGVLISSSKFNPSLYTQRGQCGGSILSKRIILTAAHCVVNEQELQDSSTIFTITMPINMEFQAGIYKLDESPVTERKYSLAGVVVHAEYDTFDLSNDIALVITKEDIEFNDNIKTISLPEQTDIAQLYAEGAPATVIGWGLTETGSLTTELKKLPYEVVSDSQCKEVYGASIKPGMMCTGRAPMTEKHAAPGDSGGPVFVKKAADDFVQIGLVSWGPEVSDQDTKTWDVNADVGYYLKWISDNMNALFTDYVTTTYAEDTPKSISYQNIRNFLFKTVTILPTDTSKYSTIIFKSGEMGRNDLVMVYDGSDISSDKQLAQLTGTISELTVTATTNKLQSVHRQVLLLKLRTFLQQSGG
ncbi:hypothetical protein ACHWQZ_G009307 [Mnemiopsis leidyi]